MTDKLKSKRLELIKKAKVGMQKAFSRKDLVLMQAIRAIDDLDKAKSLLYTRLDEWFKFNFPEVNIQNEEVACRLIAEFGDKSELEYVKLAEIVGDEKATELMQAAEGSFGASFDIHDKKAIVSFAKQTLMLFETRRAMEKYIEQAAKQAFPSLCTLIEPLLVMRLVTIAGGIERLSKKPASTIQVLGAEKALFKHLRRGTNPPKHGVLFQSSWVRSANDRKRGRVARSLAAKLAIAAKADYYGKHNIGPMLKEKLEKSLRTPKNKK